MAIYIGNHNLRFTVDVTEETEKDFWEKTEDEGAKKQQQKEKTKRERNTLILFPPLLPIFLLFLFFFINQNAQIFLSMN